MRLSLPIASNHLPTGQLRRPANVAHRGASAKFPENSVSAMRHAIALGADLIEVDVQRCRDGALVLMHDTTLARTTNAQRVFPSRGPWNVADFTYEELTRLDAGAWKSRAFAGERIPTLEDALELVNRSETGLLLELKAPELYPGIAYDVVTTMDDIPGYVESAVASRRLVVQSFNFAAMKDHKTQAPAIPVGLLGAPARVNLPVLASWADQVNPGHLTVDRAYVDHVHELGMDCLVWTVDWGLAMRRAISLGVDGIITNRPEVLGKLLARSGRSAGDPRSQGLRARWAGSPSRCDGSPRWTGGTCPSRTSRPVR
jgi:glycerophosphoryl diester phosphodiesterase